MQIHTSSGCLILLKPEKKNKVLKKWFKLTLFTDTNNFIKITRANNL